MAIDPGATRAPADSDPAARIHERLKVYFAMISCLGGLVLGTEPQTESLPAIAIFFAVFGYVFVDWLRLFALPSIAAYAAMGLAALYCVSDFAELEGQGNHQIVVVAELLVMVQAILMLQTKTRRIFEQLGVFCLLQLVVAAVFNDAISYGLFLIPISVIGAWALSLLAAASALEPPSKRGSGEPATVPPIRCSAVSAQRSLVGASGRLPRIALWGIAPAAALVSAVFFYALPRTTDAAHLGERGDTLVGFRDEVRLEQFGEMLRSSKPAMRVKLTDARTGRNYRAVGGIYLRGRVLERYQAAATSEMSTAIWFATTPGSADATGRLPTEYVPRRASDKNFYDTVKARIKCESMGSSSLFAIAPYHRVAGRHGIEHLADRWTLRRRADQPPEMSLSFPRIEYAFGTHAFHRGVQSELVARRSVRARSSRPPSVARGRWDPREARLKTEDADRGYLESLLAYNPDDIPAARRIAEAVRRSLPAADQSAYTVAKALEQRLKQSARYTYTLDLDADPVPGMDPIEQFLSVDRRGHCQYFASALAMMLRSVGIPARLVVGYQTEEYSELGQVYIARQLHAHAWVEALVGRNELPEDRMVYGQEPSEEYWLRLDPTPGVGREIGGGTGGVRHVFDFAQGLWEDYIVDMDRDRQTDTLLNTPGMSPLAESYREMIGKIQTLLRKVKAGELGGGSFAADRFFSWPAAVVGIAFALVIAALFRMRMPPWIRRRDAAGGHRQAARPSLPFYAETLDQVARLGVVRRAGQTPGELMRVASAEFAGRHQAPLSGPLARLTAAFYRLRFGGGEDNESVPGTQRNIRRDLDELRAGVDAWVERGGGRDRTTGG